MAISFCFSRYFTVCFCHRRILRCGLLVQLHQISTVTDQARSLFAISTVAFANPRAEQIFRGGSRFIVGESFFMFLRLSPQFFGGILVVLCQSFVIVAGSGIFEWLG